MGYRNPEMLERQPSGNAEPAAGRTRRRGPYVTAKPGGVGRGCPCEGSPEPRPQQPGTGGHPARGPGGSRLGAGGKPGEGVRMEEQSLSRELSVADPVVCGRRQGQVAAGVGGSWGAGLPAGGWKRGCACGRGRGPQSRCGIAGDNIFTERC